MTEIHTNTTRVTRGAYNVLHHRKARRIVATFCVGDFIQFRELGRRGRYDLPLEAAFRIAVRSKVEADRRARKEGKR